MHVIPNPLYSLPEPRLSLDDDKTLLAMGRLDRQKGFDLLLHAFAQSGLSRQGWRVCILGEGQERTALSQLAYELKISDDVDMPGVVTEPDLHMRQGGIFVFSSRFEGFGNALLEAMGMGMAVVSFDCDSGPGELIRHDENGLLVAAEDVGSLAATLAGDVARRQRLGARALEVRPRYDVNTILGEWDRVIERVTNGRAG